MHLLIMTLVFAGVPVVLLAAVVVAVQVVRWARRNRERAARMMLGTYLSESVGGGPIDTNDDGVVSRFLDWMSGGVGSFVDSFSSAPSSADEAQSGDCGGGYASTSSHEACASSDGGGVCQ